MLLADWLTLTKTTKAAFAARIGVSPSAMTGICSGTKWVSARVALAIETETKGAVTVRDLLRALRREGSGSAPPDRGSEPLEGRAA